LLRGELSPTAQVEERASYAPPLEAKDSFLDPARAAVALRNQVRGLAPRPGAWALLRRASAADRRLKLLDVHVLGDTLPSGILKVRDGEVVLGCGRGSLAIVQAQAEGKRAQSARDLINGRVIHDGDELVFPGSASP
jgi:methionyl-tRNA formyltransferase